MSRAVAALLAAALLLAPNTAVAARPRASLDQIEREVMCVTCRIPLDIADSPEADRERAFIRTLIRQGKTEDQIKQALVAQYGERVLATPSKSGIDLAVWLIPLALLVAGLATLAVLLPRWRRRATPTPTPTRLDPAAARRLDDELARFDG